MKRIWVLMCGMGFLLNAYSQTEGLSNDTTISKEDDSKYFYKVTNKEFSELKKKEVAFVFKGVEYRIQGGDIFKMRSDKNKLRKLEAGEVQDMMSGVPAASKLFNAGAFLSASAQTFGAVTALVGESMKKNAMKDFYNQFLSSLPKENAQYALNYQPEPYVRLTDRKASTIGWDTVAFTYDGVEYYTRRKYIYRKSGGFNGFLYKKRGIRPLLKAEAADLMGPVYGRQYVKGYRMQIVGSAFTWCLPVSIPLWICGTHKQKRNLNEFYASMNTSGVPVRQVAVVSPVEELSKETLETQPPVVEESMPVEEPEMVVAKDSVAASSNQAMNKAAEPVKDTVAVVKEEIKEEPKVEKTEKPKKERKPKLNELKRNGYGLFVDAGGCIFDGPRLGVEMRFNRCIPSVFVGYPNVGVLFKKDHNNLSDMQSISAGAGVKGLVPASWGGFYAGGTLLYERYVGTVDKSTVYAQKKLNNDASVLANIGFRFQTKFNLFFNVGGMVGPTFEFGASRYSNPLLYDYSPKYQSEDMKISLKKMGELSIGYEF